MFLIILIAAGLSPLARGTRQSGSVKRTECRFIPAGAGNTFFGRSDKSARPVYPRWRGEHTFPSAHVEVFVGLSPLARGTPWSKVNIYSGSRFIPAGAGNTSGSANDSSGLAVYPRWRGEHAQPFQPAVTDLGLSPLARGTQMETISHTENNRFIPAGAGNTVPQSL